SVFFLLLLRLPLFTLFPYTTLFRSVFYSYNFFVIVEGFEGFRGSSGTVVGNIDNRFSTFLERFPDNLRVLGGGKRIYGIAGQIRSEEHTSELQSRENLVCRLLLEKK